MGANFGSPNAISIAATGKTVTSGASTASQALTNVKTANGTRAKAISVCCTAAAHINFSVGNGTATADDYLITTTPVIFNIQGFDTMNHIQEGSAAKITVTPIEV